jgi:citrate synthase
MEKTRAHSGLEGIVVADTTLSEVDGERGRLIIAGEDVERLAGSVRFEEVCAKLWGQADVARRLGQARQEAFALLPKLRGALEATDGMDALRGAVAQLTARGGPDDGPWVTGAMAVFAAAWARRLRGLDPVAPRPDAGHAEDYLRMATGSGDVTLLGPRLDAYLVAVSDHGMNASTFAARVVASTGSDAVSAVTAAVGALKGPLHGGAPGPVLDMLDAIQAADAAASWLGAELDAGRRIMGMGHRIYRVRDPRAAVLEKQIELYERQAASPSPRLQLARAVERAAESLLKQRHPDRALRANVEFYTAVLLEAVGLSRTQFSPTFAVGRVAGWFAHVEEQRRTGRLIRPASRYIGPLPVK